MPTNPIQPNKGNRDEALSRTGAAANTQPQSGQNNPTAKQGQGGSRDEGSRSFRSGSDTSSTDQSRTGGSSEINRCLDSIEENISKVRQALSGSGREGASQGSDRQSSDRQSSDRQGSESGARSSRNDSDESGSERNRDVSTRL